MRERKGLMKTFTGGGALAVALLAFGAEPVSGQVGSPLQPGHYAPGIINIRDVVTPPPGFFVIWYNWGLWSDGYYDRNGNKLTSINLSQLDPSLPDVDVDLKIKGFATVPVLAWASTFTLLGGARYEVAIAPNFAVADVSFVGDPGGPGFPPDQTVSVEGSVSGFSDLVVVPLGLSWALGRFSNPLMSDEEFIEAGLEPFRRFNLTVAYSFAAPTGRYEVGAADNIGLGFWTHQFQGFGYFFPFSHGATAIMAGLTYEANTKIKDLDLTPGNRLSLEYGVSQYFTTWFEFGIQGAHNWQVGDDSGSAVFWDPSVHDRKSTLLFSAGFWPWAGRLYVAAKYGFDYGVRQRFKNNNLMLNFIWITNALDGR